MRDECYMGKPLINNTCFTNVKELLFIHSNMYYIFFKVHVLRMERKGIALKKLGSYHILKQLLNSESAAAAAQRW